MQEICTSGSEGGGTETNRSSLPLFIGCPCGTNCGTYATLESLARSQEIRHLKTAV